MLKTRPSRALAKPCLEVSFAPQPFTLTFSQPMPASVTPRIAPAIAGEWRWQDDRTLVFQGRPRPATRYRIELPDGARALDGSQCGPCSFLAVLEGPRLVTLTPGPGERLTTRSTFKLEFDQAVEPARLLELIRVRAGRRRLRLQELPREHARQLAFLVELPRDTRVRLELPAGLPSAEGSERSRRALRLDYRTSAPLRVVRRGLAEWLAAPCTDEPLRIRFNNPLEPGTAGVTVRPALSVMGVACQGNELVIHGRRVPGVAYQVQVEPGLRDVYGQSLEAPARRKFRPSWMRPHVSLADTMVAVRPGERIPLYTAGLKSVNCRLKAVELEQWSSFSQGQPVRGRSLKSWKQPVPNWRALETSWLEVGEDVGHRVLEVWAGHLVAVLWLQVTELNLQASAYPEGMSVMVTGADGRPREGAEVTWGDSRGRTGWDGHCLLERPSGARTVQARLGSDSAFLELSPPAPPATAMRWCVLDGRGLYRPGEKACLKGWVRRSTGGIPTGVLDYRLRGRSGTVSGQAVLTPQGGFDLELELKEPAVLELELEGSVHRHELRVEEFRRPEFELDLQTLDDSTVRLSANYHAGGALAGAEVSWTHRLHERPCVPSGWEQFFPSSYGRLREVVEASSTLDEHGQALQDLPTRLPAPGWQLEIVSVAEVKDQSRQVVRGQLVTRRYPGGVMVGLRRCGASVEVVVVDSRGVPQPGRPVEVAWDTGGCRLISQDRPMPVLVPVGQRVSATVGAHRRSLGFSPPIRQQLRLPSTPVVPGQEIALQVEGPSDFRLGVLRAWVGPRRLQARVFRPDEPLTLRIPEGAIASVELQLSCLLADGRWETSVQHLPVSLRSRRLEVSVATAAEAVRPGTSTRVTVEVRDAEGRPVPDAEVALYGVDEAVLQAAGYAEPDVLEAMYPRARSGSRQGSLSNLFPRHQPPDLGPSTLYGSACMSSVVAAAPAVALREDLRPLAFFHPALTTDASGRVELEARLPDSLSRFRVTAVASCGGSFGQAHTGVTTRLPLALRPWLPRFLHEGDRFELCLGVQNLTAAAREVRVEVLVSGLAFLAGVERSCTVPAGARVEVRFPCRAEREGRAVGLARVVSGSLEDACRIDLPVARTRFPSRVTWQGRGARRLALEVPTDVEPDYGGLELVESDSATGLARDAWEGLKGYRMSCSEQLSSRLLGWVLGGPHWQPESWRGEAEALVKELLERQQPDGQFWLYPGYETVMPFVSAHAVQALLRAYTAGVDLDLQRLSRGMDYLATLEDCSTLEAAYALNVLSQVGRNYPERVEELAAHRRLTGEGMALLLPLARGRTRARLREKLLASSASGPQGVFASARRPAALAYLALGEESGQLDRLLEPNPCGNTQDHAFTLLALAGPVTREHALRSIPLAELGEGVELLRGAFYRATLTTMPCTLPGAAVNEGFAVSRTYEFGELVRIKLVVQSSSSHSMVGLIDPLPAGLELLPRSQQPRVRGAIHADYRDDCTELCFAHLARGRHELTLLARATTPGTFHAPGTRVEEMYRPGVFGQAASVLVDC